MNQFMLKRVRLILEANWPKEHVTEPVIEGDPSCLRNSSHNSVLVGDENSMLKEKTWVKYGAGYD